MKLLIILCLTLGLLLGFAGTAVAEGDPTAGRVKAETCLGCHGIPGYKNVYPTYNVPKLGGQYAEYIVSSLKAYRDGTRPHGTMHSQVADLTDEDMADIAAYFESAAELKP